MYEHEISISWDLDDVSLCIIVNSILLVKANQYPLRVKVRSPRVSKIMEYEKAPEP